VFQAEQDFVFRQGDKRGSEIRERCGVCPISGAGARRRGYAGRRVWRDNAGQVRRRGGLKTVKAR
jgi:hypothetical protein